MFAEDLTPFFNDDDGFAVAAGLGGKAVVGQYDVAGVALFGGDVASTSPTFLMAASDVPADAVGLTLVIAAGPGVGSYIVRGFDPEPPDGVMVRLHLAGSR